jgi:hypothetical protein
MGVVGRGGDSGGYVFLGEAETVADVFLGEAETVADVCC